MHDHNQQTAGATVMEGKNNKQGGESKPEN